MSIEKQEQTLKEKFVEACYIPKETVLGYSIISIVGNRELMIENHRGIIEYHSELIRISTKLGQIKICGKELDILQYANNEIKIEGVIISLELI